MFSSKHLIALKDGCSNVLKDENTLPACSVAPLLKINVMLPQKGIFYYCLPLGKLKLRIGLQLDNKDKKSS